MFNFFSISGRYSGCCHIGLCPGVPVHKGNSYCTPLFSCCILLGLLYWFLCTGTRGQNRHIASLSSIALPASEY